MASKINKKFVLVAGGFTAAAVVLLGAVLFINYAYLQNADRHIAKGDALMTIEAMKMQTSIRAERDGRIAEVAVQPGAQVESKDLLVIFE